MKIWMFYFGYGKRIIFLEKKRIRRKALFEREKCNFTKIIFVNICTKL